MELTDSSSDELRDNPKLGATTTAGDAEPTRSFLGIDLNEIPSPTETLPLDSIDVVRSYHDNPSPPPGGPAAVPAAALGSYCAVCGKPEGRDYVVVCDACERGFHLGCARMRGPLVSIMEEWVCRECECSGVKSKRWPLGKSKRILDMNASPPSDGDGDAEGTEDVLDSRKHTLGGNSFGGNPFDAPVTYSNFLCTGNGFGFQKAPGLLTHTVKVGFEDLLHRTNAMGKSFEEVDLSFPFGRCRSSNNSDGKTFDSVYEVACYLGLMSKYSSKEPERRIEGGFSISEKTNLPRKRKARRFAMTNGFSENKETSVGGCKDLPCNGPSMEVRSITFDNNAQFMEAGAGEIGRLESEKNNEGLPVQFEDFFLLSTGKVDMRPSYHDARFLWPVGFKSCWHDKITGSLFVCEILDGGEGGPVFKVKRFSCSAVPVPYCSTVLFRQSSGQFMSPMDDESDEMTCDNIDSIRMILSDPCPPMENDIVSCLGNCSNGGSDFQTSTKLQQEACCSTHENSENGLSCEMGSIDEIGEFSAEKKSLSLAWRMISQKIVNACTEIFKQKGTFRFFCKHVVKDGDIPNYLMKNETSKGNFSSLDKFSSSQGCFDIPFVIHADKEIDSLNDIVEKWLDQDRFGLDVDFVQEILEQLPGVQTCSQYQMLSERSSHSSSITIGNGLLVPNMRGGLECKEKGTLNGLFRRSKKAKLVESDMMDNHCRPPGKQLCSKVPKELVGDVYQVWELLWRFYDILGLDEPLSLEELEEELSNPWFDNSELLEKFEQEIRGSQDLNSKRTDTDCTDAPAFIQMETGAMKEAAQRKLASMTYSRCSGVALTKAHNSLLRLLVGELQFKVAALVDPNFDSGESRSKRGRKKDVDSSLFVKRTKLNILPINELTWPELAHRYILAVLSMDGNLDSAEITARESGKVFRCLQGDGGVLCGSLTGVAGMEADALLLAEASKQIFGSMDRDNDVLTFEDDEPDAAGASEKNLPNDGNTPEWAKVLEPVRKLPTNVGTRIRKCVYEALAKDPPEWAKKILEHSISKEVYKGNASGPTKKAVLSVLADICGGEGLPPKPDKRKKRKTVISISDAVMKQCRIVLRRAAAADDSKVFCNLLGRKLINSTDNDDEGLLGLPAMVSRPLDFRTIDLRLAAGAYGSSHEAFLEDVRELWSNVRNAFGDQPDLTELADTLSQNFESLYDKEVVSLVNKFAEFAKLDCLNAERRKEIDDLLSSTSLIPKAPWDEGVCKVCGIDRDDDSVLLCDTCDAEYHTYCLNPPLARIPEGNWYCPSCVGKRVVQDVPENIQVIRQRSGKKYQGEVTRVYLEALTLLASKMEEKEYWEFTVDERTFMLKFLCDELLNSAIIRQHLEQCAETSTELQQKLRSLFVEWKNLKSREETLVARAAKLDPNILNSHGAVDIKDSSPANHSKPQLQALGERSSADDLPAVAGDQEAVGKSCSDRRSSATESENNCRDISDNEFHLKEANASAGESNTITHMDSQKNEKPFGLNDLPASNSLPHEVDGSSRELCSTSNQQGLIRTSSSHQPLDQHGHSDARGTSVVQHVSPVVVNELQAYQAELNSVKSDISLLQGSITSVELELLKVSVRREFLGSDSVGCLYWASGTPTGHAQIIVDGSVALQNGRKMNCLRGKVGNSSAFQCSIQPVVNNDIPSEGSKDFYPYQCQRNNGVVSPSPWVSYKTDEEINELINCLKNNDTKEKELKESILHWQKLRFQEFEKGQFDLAAFSATTNEKALFSDYLVTKASCWMEKRYGPFVELESADVLKKRGKRARLSNDDKMYRCECLEIIWPRRPHCLSCHRTFLNDNDLEGHNEGRCNSAVLAHEKGKEPTDAAKVKATLKSVSSREDRTGEMSRAGIPKTVFSELSAKLIKFQDEGFACPYDFEEICSKFVTQDSCKNAIQEIGLLGSKGVPSFVPSMSPYLTDVSLALMSYKDVGLQGDGSETAERLYSLGNANATVSGHDSLSDRSPKISAEINVVVKSQKPGLGCLEQRDRVHSSGSHSPVNGVTRCCVVPQSSLRPLVGKVSHILRRLKMNLLDMDAALPEEALRPSKSNLGRRWAWRAFVKSATTIYEMVQATIVLEDMIKTEYLRNEWWYWSSFSAAAKTSTISALALRIYSLDAAIVYEKVLSDSDPTDHLEPVTVSEPKLLATLDTTERTKITRRSNKKRKEPEG
ncbi:methyl-CpG-binding domain-containing protein 9 isoform X2 [Humulus lupulus]|uniref:methyl-CpG-binding domain-containing protein 9 isoform X2 n=1 Tax=Humulus lupulus TaxID=3486 RepID=UPI002B412AA7|nr:methyl-CpG-binding domain-containing protein 9 isoform X2 [Humulus lupulus]